MSVEYIGLDWLRRNGHGKHPDTIYDFLKWYQFLASSKTKTITVNVEPCNFSFHWNQPALQDPGSAWRFARLDGLCKMLSKAAAEEQWKPDPTIPFSVEPSEKVFKDFMLEYFQE